MSDLALYVHWPFCTAKCPYCDFNSHVTAAVDHKRWRRALTREIAHAAAETGSRRLTSIFFGGGTPSLMEPASVEAVVDAAARVWKPAHDIEITLEANPTSVEQAKFESFRSAGVNRVSVGVQSLDDTALRRLGRLHDSREALAAVELAQAMFERTSFDLIYARQNQTVDDWQQELSRALSLGPDHLSLYQLTIEPGTAFHERLRRGGLAGLPDEDRGADLWEVTQELCEAAGLPAYEISNHARPGSESRHNLTYWRNGDWVGIGPGAHGRLSLGDSRIATVSERQPARWLELAEGGGGQIQREELSREETARDALMMGLRLAEGVPTDRVKPLLSVRFCSIINSLRADGFLELRGKVLRASSAGRPLLNAILRQLMA